MIKSVGADISIRRKSQNIISPLEQTNIIDKLVAAPINSMVFKKKITQSMVVSPRNTTNK